MLPRSLLFAPLAIPILLVGCSSKSQAPQSKVPVPEIAQEAIDADRAARDVPPEVLGFQRLQGVINGQQDKQGFTLPQGFALSVFADELTGPRRLAIAPGGTARSFDVFVSESSANRVRVLRDSNGDGKADASFIWNDQLNQPYGIAWIGKTLYVANTDAIVRFAYAPGQTQASAPAQHVADLTKGGYNQHWTRNLLASRDNKQLFVTVGSSCNTCEEDDEQRAAISVLNPDGSDKRVYARGLRNPVGMAWRPDTNELWAAVNERDNLGDNTPPDYLTQVRYGCFYGWPYSYTDMNRQIQLDPTWGPTNPKMAKITTIPDLPVQAHSANLGVAFAPLKATETNFPTEFRGDAFLTFHGSWNRSEKTGYKIVRVDFVNNKPRAISDFLVGFLKSDGTVEGRPVDIQSAPDGSLLFSDDTGGKIWRIAYVGDKSKAKS